MKHLKRKDGFTLVELVVGIAAASLVLAAASSLLLMGARIQRTLRDEAQEQQTIRIVLTMLEDLVAEGQIKSIETDGSKWELKAGEGESSAIILTFKDGQLLGVGNSVLLDGLQSATANLNGNLLNFTFTTDRGTYETSTYCRTVVVKDKQKNENISKEEGVYNPEAGKDGDFKNNHLQDNEAKDARYAFLQTLCAEYGSTGAIKHPIVGQRYQYYSEWYIEGYKNGWNSSTPWCACFLSWAAAKNAASLSSVPKFANVNTGVSKFRGGTCGTWKNIKLEPYTPIPGDYIFFDWECDDDPDHVGAVLFVYKDTTVDPENTTVYTIEGNSGGRVAIHSYNINDPRIYGYGVLNWKTSAGT